MSAPRPPTPKVVRRETLVRGKRFDFEEVELEAGGERFRRQHIRHPGAVCVLPLKPGVDGGTVVLVRNYRAAIDQWVLELPAGTLEDGEEPAACAARELIEETGYRAATLRPVGRFHTSPGLSDEVMWAFLATDLEKVGQELEAGEFLEVVELPLAAAVTRARGGELTDAKTMLTLLLAEDLGMVAEWKP